MKDKTLVDKQIDKTMTRLARAFEKEFGARARGNEIIISKKHAELLQWPRPEQAVPEPQGKIHKKKEDEKVELITMCALLISFAAISQEPQLSKKELKKQQKELKKQQKAEEAEQKLPWLLSWLNTRVLCSKLTS